MDDHIMLRPFEKPVPRSFKKDNTFKMGIYNSPLVKNASSVRKLSVVTQPECKPPCPGLNVKHGFLVSIQQQILKSRHKPCDTGQRSRDSSNSPKRRSRFDVPKSDSKPRLEKTPTSKPSLLTGQAKSNTHLPVTEDILDISGDIFKMTAPLDTEKSSASSCPNFLCYLPPHPGKPEAHRNSSRYIHPPITKSPPGPTSSGITNMVTSASKRSSQRRHQSRRYLIPLSEPHTPFPQTPSNMISDVHPPRNALAPSSGGDGYFNFIHQVYELDATWDEVDVEGYPTWAHHFICEAYHDPLSVSPNCLEAIGKLITERAWSTEGYRLIAARLCQRIAKKEFDREETANSEASLPFTCGVLKGLSETFIMRLRLQAGDRQQWYRYAAFCSDILMRLTFGTYPSRMLCELTLNIILIICAESCLDNTQQVSTLTEMLYRAGLHLQAKHGEQLAEVLSHMRETLLAADTPRSIRLNLLLIMELMASDWVLSPRSQASYLSMCRSEAAELFL